MYNRYVPQPDGSFRRNRIPDPVPDPPRPEPPREETRRPEPPQQPQQSPCQDEQDLPTFRKPQSCPSMRNGSRPSPPPRQNNPPRPQPRREPGVGNFLRQLLPREFDTEDLLVVLLLLLMSADCQEEQNTAMLTLALYLFL